MQNKVTEINKFFRMTENLRHSIARARADVAERVSRAEQKLNRNS
jgi:hypothetical protein